MEILPNMRNWRLRTKRIPWLPFVIKLKFVKKRQNLLEVSRQHCHYRVTWTVTNQSACCRWFTSGYFIISFKVKSISLNTLFYNSNVEPNLVLIRFVNFSWQKYHFKRFEQRFVEPKVRQLVAIIQEHYQSVFY